MEVRGTVILVTGGSGYFGSLLVRMLRARGEDCRVYDLADAADRPPEVEYIAGDIRDLAAVSAACRGVDIVHHNVAQVPLARDRQLFQSVNVQGTENLLTAARAAGVRKVIHTSSSAVFGAPKRNPVIEAMLPQPGEAYGRAKLAAELLCRAHAERGLDVTIVRPRTILGHGRLGIFQILFEWVRTGYNIPVFNRGDNLYQFVHAEDLADACIRASARPGPTVYHCGADRFGTMRQGLEALCRHAGTGSKVRSVPAAPAVLGMKLAEALGLSPLGAYHALMYGRAMYFEITKARTELGWQPRYSNEEMLIESYDWYVRNREQVLAAGSASHHRSPVKERLLNLVKRVL